MEEMTRSEPSATVPAPEKRPVQVRQLEKDIIITDLADTADKPAQLLSAVVEDRDGTSEPPMPHPELEDLYMVNADTMERVTLNAVPVVLDNDLFHGVVLMMVRTSDADGDVNDPRIGHDSCNNAVSSYFRSKQRRFEFQYQIKLKKVPASPLYLSAELDIPVKLGMIQRAFMAATLNFVKKMNDGFHYSFAGQEDVDDLGLSEGRYQKAHIAFKVDGSMDRIVATKPGKEPPKLGQAIHEDPESIKRRKRGGAVDWNTKDTYTMALFSAYFDFVKWKALNLPGIRPFSLTSVIGSQHLSLTLYSLQEQHESEGAVGCSKGHNRCDMELFTNIEISHRQYTSIGPCAKKLIAKAEANKKSEVELELPPQEEPVDAAVDVVEGQDEEETYGSDDNSDGETDSADEDEALLLEEDDDAPAEELEEGMYMRSGDRLLLREPTGTVADEDDYVGSFFLTNGGGFAVLQSQIASTIVIERAFPPKRGSPPKLQGGGDVTHSEELCATPIRNGDVVMIKLLLRKEGKNDDIKYLSVHRGWWLKWVSHVPRHNGYFTIVTHETFGRKIEEGCNDAVADPLEAQRTFVRLGSPFLLRHRRWKRYEVGVSIDQSVVYGGPMLALLKRVLPNTTVDYEPENMDDVDDLPRDHDFDGSFDGKVRRQWMRPLRFCADPIDPSGTGVSMTPSLNHSSPALPDEQHSNLVKSISSVGGERSGKFTQYHIDVPAWVEMMHRTKRQHQRVYVIRVRKKERVSGLLSEKENLIGTEGANSREPRASVEGTTSEQATGMSSKEGYGFIHDSVDSLPSKIRMFTGKDLTPILQAGLSQKDLNSNSIESQLKEPLNKIHCALDVDAANDGIKRSVRTEFGH